MYIFYFWLFYSLIKSYFYFSVRNNINLDLDPINWSSEKCKTKSQLVIGQSEDWLRESDNFANMSNYLMNKSNTLVKLMVNLEKNGSIKSNLNYKRKIQLSLYPTFLMGIKSFLKVMPFVSTFATKLIEKIF